MKYEYDFSNLHLPAEEYRWLLLINYHKLKYSHHLDALLETELIEFKDYATDSIGQRIPIKDYCVISEKGRCYIIYRKNNFVNIRIPVILSIIAIIVSIIFR